MTCNESLELFMQTGLIVYCITNWHILVRQGRSGWDDGRLLIQNGHSRTGQFVSNRLVPLPWQ